MLASHDLFATCPKGLESLLLAELLGLGASDAKETVAGVYFTGPLRLAYRVCMWTRFATQVLLPLGQFDCSGPQALYEGARTIRWFEHIGPEDTFSIAFSGRAEGINNTQFGAQRVKDALADVCRERWGRRPSVDRSQPDLRFNVRVYRGRATVSLNLAGESLHRRGYRVAGGPAPLKENLAAAIVQRAGWPEHGDPSLLDPMCGSGTLLIEAAYAVLNIPSGFQRKAWGFEAWRGHEASQWDPVSREATERAAEALAASPTVEIRGADLTVEALDGARRNVHQAGLMEHITLERSALADLVIPSGGGLILTNPPYGERIGDVSALLPVYESMGVKFGQASEWRAAVFTGNPELGHAIGLNAKRQYRLWNGPIPARLLLFNPVTAGGASATAPSLVAGAGPKMFANRLAKRDRQLKRWAKRQGTNCYRIYDADLPEYAVAVDRYADWVHVAEYKAPAKVDAALAKRRLTDVVLSIPSVLDVPSHRIVVKQRTRQQGKDQYPQRARTEQVLEVQEHPAKLLVNLRDYLDTGLFLDHRALRRRIGALVAGKRFLNLYCYTATATVHAALGGAAHSVSVDLSPTYLEWARRNFLANRIDERVHELLRADCVEWLGRGEDRFDVILLDPPTFSNSKRLTRTLDVQRDHGALIEAAGRRLAVDGVLIFSTNRRRFELDAAVAASFDVEDVTHWSVDRDFERARNRHHCWFLTLKSASSASPLYLAKAPRGGGYQEDR